MAEETEKTAEAEEIIIEGAFSVSEPVPNNKRIISIAGLIPSCDSPTYWLFEKFLWTLVGLDKETTAPITLFINSYGGDADSFFQFYDFITMLKSPIRTVTNKAESAGAMMFILGAKGHRYIFPNAHIFLHGIQMMAYSGRENEDKLLTLYNRRLADIIDKRSGRRILKLLPNNLMRENDRRERILAILTLLRNEVILTADEAIKYGLADYIVTPEIFDEIQRT